MDLITVFKEFRPIETKNMRLRKLKREDAVDFYSYYQNKEVYRYLNWNGPISLEESYQYIDTWNRGPFEGRIICFAVSDRITDKIIGSISLGGFEGRMAEVGYELSADYWRKGIMSDAMQEVLKIGFKKLDLLRIHAFVSEKNEASKRLLEKFGFQKEGRLRLFDCHLVTGECRDVDVYSLLQKEFLKDE